jgi:hypothetical protein
VKKPVKILIVEDSEDDAKLALWALRSGGFDPAHRRVPQFRYVRQRTDLFQRFPHSLFLTNPRKE